MAIREDRVYRQLNPGKLYIFGSFLRDPRAAQNLDLAIRFEGLPGDPDAHRLRLRRVIERLAHRLGKPVDAFVDPFEGQLNEAYYYDPHTRTWDEESQRFAGAYFFEGLQLLDLERLLGRKIHS